MQLKTNNIGQKLLRGHESYFEAGQSLIKWCKLTLGASRLAIFQPRARASDEVNAFCMFIMMVVPVILILFAHSSLGAVHTNNRRKDSVE